MEKLIVHMENGGLIFSLTYILAFGIVILLFIIKSVKKGNSVLGTLLTGTAATLFFAIGLILFSMDIHEFIIHGRIFFHGEQNFLGGVAGLIAGAGIASVLLKMKNGILDDFAIGLPIGISVHRIGCFISGCCFGKPSDLPWAISYPAGSHAFEVYPCYDGFSLPLHPVQLYEVFFGLVIAAVVFYNRKRIKTSGGLFLLSVSLYASMWFFTEFFRDAAGVYSGGAFFLHLRISQWALLLASVSGFLLLFFRERNLKFYPEKPESKLIMKIILLMILTVFFFMIRRNIYMPTQLLASLLLLITFFLTFIEIFKKFTLPGYRTISVALLGSPLFFMSQTIINSNPGKSHYTEFGINTTYNRFSNTMTKCISYSYDGYHDDCGEFEYEYDTKKVTHNYYSGGFHVSKTYINLENQRRKGYYVNGFLGSENSNAYQEDNKVITGGINGGFALDIKRFGLRAGIWSGYFYVMGLDDNSTPLVVGEFMGNYKRMYVFPQVALRLGQEKYCYVKLRMGDPSPSLNLPVFYHIGLGSGLGKRNNSSIELGWSAIGYYGEGNIRVYKNLFLTGTITGGGLQNNTCYAIGFRVRFNEQMDN